MNFEQSGPGCFLPFFFSFVKHIARLFLYVIVVVYVDGVGGGGVVWKTVMKPSVLIQLKSHTSTLLILKSRSLVRIGLANVAQGREVPLNRLPSTQIAYVPSDEPKTRVSRSHRMKKELRPVHVN